MKFYNPFKWHIIEQNDLFYVRKYTIGLGWLYLDNKKYTTFTWIKHHDLSQFSSLEDAKLKLKNYPVLLEKEKESQKIKVHV